MLCFLRLSLENIATVEQEEKGEGLLTWFWGALNWHNGEGGERKREYYKRKWFSDLLWPWKYSCCKLLSGCWVWVKKPYHKAMKNTWAQDWSLPGRSLPVELCFPELSVVLQHFSETFPILLLDVLRLIPCFWSLLYIPYVFHVFYEVAIIHKDIICMWVWYIL